MHQPHVSSSFANSIYRAVKVMRELAATKIDIYTHSATRDCSWTGRPPRLVKMPKLHAETLSGRPARKPSPHSSLRTTTLWGIRMSSTIHSQADTILIISSDTSLCIHCNAKCSCFWIALQKCSESSTNRFGTSRIEEQRPLLMITNCSARKNAFQFR